MSDNQAAQRRRPTLKGVVQTIIIVLLCWLMLMAVEQLVMNKTSLPNVMVHQELEGQTWDVVFAGSSHMLSAALPMQLWEEQGFTAYNNGQAGEIIPVSYYTIREVIEQHHPKVIVLDLYMLYFAREYGNIEWLHASIDGISLKNRMTAIVDLLPVSRWEEFIFPLVTYHTRWKNMTAVDFAGTKPSLALGSSIRFEKDTALGQLAYEVIPPEVKVTPPEVAVAYLEKIARLCKDTGTELMLVALPYCTAPGVEDATHDMTQDEALMNWATDFAAQHGLHYVNYFHLREDLGFSWGEHLRDYSHMNYRGAEIITRHMGEYLTAHYDLPDRRNDPAFAGWNEALPRYHAYLEKLMADGGVQ